MQLAKTVRATTYYLHGDNLGSTRLVMSSSLVTMFSTKYKPYGPTYGATGSETFKFTDKPYDPTTGLYYYGARFYDPSVGRFITRDSYNGTVRDPLSQNRYIYAEDNPLRYVDPTGHDTCHASPDACYGGPQTPMDEMTWFVTTYEKSWRFFYDIFNTFLDGAMMLDAVFGLGKSSLLKAFTDMWTSGQYVVEFNDITHDIIAGNGAGVTHDLVSITETTLGRWWGNLGGWGRMVFVMSTTGFELGDAALGGSVDLFYLAIMGGAIAWDVETTIYDANTAYSQYTATFGQ